MGESIAAIVAFLTGKMGLKLMKDKERLNNSEFAICALVAFVVVSALWSWLCGRWVAVREFFGLDLFPAFVMQIYTKEELALVPFIDGLVLYSLVYLWLKLKNYPEWLEQEEVFSWRMKRLIGYSLGMFLIFIALVVYLYRMGRFGG